MRSWAAAICASGPCALYMALTASASFLDFGLGGIGLADWANRLVAATHTATASGIILRRIICLLLIIAACGSWPRPFPFERPAGPAHCPRPPPARPRIG